MKIKNIPIITGGLGLLLIIIGTFLPPEISQKLLFASGMFLLLCSALLEQHTFFSVLEIIALIGSLIAFTSISQLLKAGIPIILSILGIIFFAYRGMFKKFENIIGSSGLLFLAAGFAISNPIVYMLGGIFLAVYSYFSYRRGARIALLFLILNIIFTITSIVGIFRLYF